MNPIASVGLSRTLARIAQIEARLREVDPTRGRLPLAPGIFPSLMPPGVPANAAGGALGSVTDVAPQRFAAAMGSLAAESVVAAGPRLVPREATGGSFVAPVRGARTTQPFGPSTFASEPPATIDGVRYEHFHDGLDLAAPLGRQVVAAADGQVVFAGLTGDGAVVVRIRHDDGSETRYGHLGAGLEVQAGGRVKAGDRVGVVGMTGNTTGPHLHFELWVGGKPLDPAPWIENGRLPGTPAPTDPVDPAAQTARGDAALAQFDLVADGIKYAPEIRAAAIEAGIEPLLLAALVRAESNFRPDAVSSAGAMGLTQLMPATARALDVADPFDPAQNLGAGAKYLADNLRLYGRVDLALAAYQAGKGAVRAAGGIPDSPTTRNYIATILRTWSGYTEAAI